MKKPLRIAQVSPLAERVPPKKYGGTERHVYTLTEELVKRGHKVTLFASGDSITSSKLKSVYPRATREAKIKDPYGVNPLSLLNIGTAYSQQENFDIIHDHCGIISLPTANLSKTPVVMTIHGPLSGLKRRNFDFFRNPNLVAISNSQRNASPTLNWIATIYHGLNLQDSPFSETNDGYLLYVGRISMEKGVHFAIDVAQDLDIPLIIAAKLEETDSQYFNEYIGPRLSDEGVRFIGEVDETQRNNLMSKALCFLHPITFKEPFGLTLIEAMACGCPVVAVNRGSIPEIVANGKTGYVVDDPEEMNAAVINIDKIKRIDCRNWVLDNFNVTKMTDAYEKVYYDIVGS